jgi:hypothetical protein
MKILDLGYSREKIGAALDILASRQGRVQERLGDAYRESLCQLNARLNDYLPSKELRENFQAIKAGLTQFLALEDEGTVEATTGILLDDQEAELAQRVVKLFEGIIVLCAAAEREEGNSGNP